MMLYPEEHFWTVPTFHGLYDDNDYNGKKCSMNCFLLSRSKEQKMKKEMQKKKIGKRSNHSMFMHLLIRIW